MVKDGIRLSNSDIYWQVVLSLYQFGAGKNSQEKDTKARNRPTHDTHRPIYLVPNHSCDIHGA